MAAVELFWHQGFEATGISELTDVMGIGRQSLYGTFGDKRSLFLAALEAYGRFQMEEFRRFLDAPGSPMENLRRLFAHLREEGLKEDFQGCMINNSMAEMAKRDPEVGEFLRAYMARVEALFHRHLEKAEAAGELRPGARPRVLARSVITTLQGLSLLAKMRIPAEMLDDVFSAILEQLETTH
jgi:TetR/AcrR family transcriptional repressor of nem operon